MRTSYETTTQYGPNTAAKWGEVVTRWQTVLRTQQELGHARERATRALKAA